MLGGTRKSLLSPSYIWGHCANPHNIRGGMGELILQDAAKDKIQSKITGLSESITVEWKESLSDTESFSEFDLIQVA